MNNKFRHNLDFSQLQISKPKNAEDAIRVVGALIDEMNRTQRKLQDTFTRLQGAVGASGDTTVLLSNISGNGTNSTTGSTTITADFKANYIAVVTGVNVITFKTPMTKDYVIIPIYITSRAIEFIDVTAIVYTVSGFTVTVPENGVLVYVVIPKTE